MSKKSWQRPQDNKKFDEGYDRIFAKKAQEKLELKCDGCISGLAIRHGLHVNDEGMPFMVCEEYVNGTTTVNGEKI